MEISEGIKKIIEENPMALATVNSEGKPHVIAVAYVKIKDNKIVITNNYMKETVENIKHNTDVSLAVLNDKWEGYRINGSVRYFEEGEWLDFVRSIKKNKGESCRGALVVEVNKVKRLA